MMKKSSKANKFLIEALVDLFPFQTAVSVLALAVLLYVPGLILAHLAGIDLPVFTFLADNKSFNLVVVGIPLFASVAKYAGRTLVPVLEEVQKCFDVPGQVFSDFAVMLDRTVKNAKGALVVSVCLDILFVTEIWRHYPRPILRVASSYTYFDWYVVLLFLVGFLVIGNAFWAALSGAYRFLHDQRMPIHPYMVGELDHMTRFVLMVVVGWSFGAAMTYIALPIGYGLAAILIGYGFFGIYQYSIHRSIMIRKNEMLRVLRSMFYVSARALVDTQVSGDLLGKSQSAEALGTALERIESFKEWPIDYSSVAKLASSGVLALGLRYFLVGSV